MEDLRNQEIAEIVRNNPYAQEVFYKYNIDFCCGGKQKLYEACQKQQIDINKIIKELQNIPEKKQKEIQNPDKLTLNELIDYIYEEHHRYIEKVHTKISQLFEKVIKAHGEKAPYIEKAYSIYKQLISELAPHMKKEEIILFPAIKKLVELHKEGKRKVLPSIRMPIAIMEQEHDASGVLIKDLKLILNNFIPPEWACNTTKLLYQELNTFEKKLLEHMHLENNILFPKALKLENSIKK